MSNKENDGGASAFSFEIDFNGLVGLVPADGGKFLVPFPNASKGLSAGFPEPIAPHLGCVVVPEQYLSAQPAEPLEGSKWATPELEFRRRGRERRSLFKMHQERLTLSYPGSTDGATGKLASLQDEQETPEDSGAPAEDDLAWMPALERTGIDGAGDFDGRLITSDAVPSRDPSFDRLIGTVLVESGALYSTGVVRKADAAIALARFAPAADPGNVKFKQAVFRKMVWQGTAAGSGLWLLLTRGEEGPYRRRRSLYLTPHEGEIKLSLHNQEVEEIVGVGQGMDPEKPWRDGDFAVGYYMSRAWGGPVGSPSLLLPELEPLGSGGVGEACKTGQHRRIAWP